ncbi:MAG TPA: DUF3568 family protein [Alphaproteobacteria bacterium]|nr:DUF3568 family protein [Alphaproteobacteria bacterium]
MKRTVMRAMLVGIICASFVWQGCGALVAGGAGAAAGAGTVAYVRGELQSTYPASFDRTWNATLGALQESNLRVTETERDGAKGTINARTADDTSVTVNLETAGPGTTAAKIRVGVFGDEEMSTAIHRRIASRLGVSRG